MDALPFWVIVTITNVAHCDAVGRGHPLHHKLHLILTRRVGQQFQEQSLGAVGADELRHCRPRRPSAASEFRVGAEGVEAFLLLVSPAIATVADRASAAVAKTTIFISCSSQMTKGVVIALVTYFTWC